MNSQQDDYWQKRIETLEKEVENLKGIIQEMKLKISPKKEFIFFDTPE